MLEQRWFQGVRVSHAMFVGSKKGGAAVKSPGGTVFLGGLSNRPESRLRLPIRNSHAFR